ncbi:hypothetical protein BDP81DRAFT_403453 [Colletotrichum phormii]|uniref:Uncharacterized protein n=1 Tax=Colletotrichum phormii TaxID=359342 RepID=A0AAJ0A0P1_9PEZI|nr:uncharacterized protein BDP81DRAFT_403453 [Colletotrichum phormii]KAK1641361.1 hypothetical protein BDP81DRAFT_403453 [Colletotrichum phormii]
MKGFNGRGRATAKRLEALEKAHSLGEATNVVFYSIQGIPTSFSASGDRQGENYWEVPVSSMLSGYMASRRVLKLQLTGIAMEGDVFANADIEMFAMNITKALEMPNPVALQLEDKKYQIGYGNPSALGRMDDLRVRELSSAAFEAPSRDGSLFGAPMHSDKSSRSMVCETKIGSGNPFTSYRAFPATTRLSTSGGPK